MNYWLSHLPLEVWVDVYRYPWISREELGRIVHRFRNRRYTEYLQFYLHDWGKHKLKKLWFDQDGLYKHIDYQPYRLYMDFPLTPMPDKITSFQRITIEFVEKPKIPNFVDRYFDEQTIAFLRRIRAILSDVHLDLCVNPQTLDNLRIILVNVLPLLNSIHSLSFDVPTLPTVLQCFGKEELHKINKLAIYHTNTRGMDEVVRQTTVNFVVDWLNSSSAENDTPKWCVAFFNGNAFGQQICSAIREEFLMARTPRTFALNLHAYCVWDFAAFHLNNDIGEELHALQIGYGGHIQITRHLANLGKQMAEWTKGIEAKHYSARQNQIDIYNPTIGSLDAMDAPENAEEDQQKPSTSKDA